MIKRFTLVCLLTQALFLSASAQTVITYAGQAMREGDVLSLKVISDTIKAGASGANQVWDYSKAKTTTDFVINYNANNSQVAIPGNAFACNENNERTSYFQITPQKKLYYGLSTSKVEIRFDEPITELAFPFAYQSEINGLMKGSYTEGGITSAIDGTYKTVADAWGTLILPNGVKLKNVLRVTSTRDYKHDVMGTPFHIVVTRYAFYVSNSRYAVLQIKEATMKCDCGCNSREYSAYYNPNVKAECAKPEEPESTVAQAKFEYKVYPNPFEKDVRLDYTLKANASIKIVVLDLQGHEVKTVAEEQKTAGSYSQYLNIEGSHSQNYILQMKVNNAVYTEHLIKKAKGSK